MQLLQYTPLCQTNSGYTMFAVMVDTLTDQQNKHPHKNDEKKKICKGAKSTSTKTSLEALTNKQTGGKRRKKKKKKISHVAQLTRMDDKKLRKKCLRKILKPYLNDAAHFTKKEESRYRSHHYNRAEFVPRVVQNG